MINDFATVDLPLPVKRRSDQLFHEHQHQVFVRTDRMFAALIALEWLASIATACWLSPRAWAGLTSTIHIHVWAAVALGGVIAAGPIALAIWQPGRALTRHMIAVAQMLFSALLIHLTGGRIETHFHVFGSLAFLAFYRDWRVLLTASAVVVVDHLIRGVYWPQSVFGVLSVSWLRSLEHAAWVVFEDIFLVRACVLSAREMRQIADRTAELEATNAQIEQRVTERSRQLLVSDERARRILRTATDAFVAINQQGLIIEWNGQAETTFGWTADAVMGQPITETFIPERYIEAHREGFQKFLATGEGPFLGRSVELAARRCDGSEIPVELTISATQFDGSWLFSAFIRDITVRKGVEAELQRAKEAAEAANRAKSDFLANMSHEIRTPMNGIIGMTELALDTDLNPVQRDYLETVATSADSLLGVINDILDFSKIEAGKLSLENTLFDLFEVLGNTCKTLGLRAHQSNLELVCHIEPDVPQHLVGDAGRLRQIIVNLIGNAIKFTAQGEVVLQVGVEHQTDQQAVLHFTVSDTGVGIPREKQAIIFNAFEQVDTSTTREYGGTGLGLAITSRLVRLMGGDIGLESSPEQGSKFSFTARFGLPTEWAVPISARRVSSLHQLRVLIVDDNATNRRILEEVLTHWGMQPTAVSDGPTAITALEAASASEHAYSLVLLDAQMPFMDGFTVAERIKHDRKILGVTVMMLSSVGQVADAERCQELGLAGCLVKPIQQSELFDAIVDALHIDPSRAAAERGGKRGQNADGEIGSEKPRGQSILLAEDNAVNRRVAVGILQKRGHRVVAVDNGREALQALHAATFDLVLMDVQMPVMDGFAATAAIRDAERLTGKHLPIIAMTARAMKGDREECFAAGMDAYISKPLHAHELHRLIAKVSSPHWQPEPVASAAEEDNALASAATKPSQVSSPSADAPLEPVIDFDALLQRVEQDSSLMAEMIELYLQTAPQLLADIETGVRRHEPALIQRSAHALKGALQNLSAAPSAAAAQQLEQAGRGDRPEAALEDLQALRRELNRLQSELTSWTKGVCV